MVWWSRIASSAISSTPFDALWLRSREFEQAVQEEVAASQYDALHVDTIGLLPAVPKGSRRVVLNHHNVESQMLRRRAEREGNWWKRRFIFREALKTERWERTYCASVDINLVVSPLDQSRLDHIAPGCRVAVVENGVDVQYVTPNPEALNGPRLLFTGTMGWYPNDDAMRWFLTDIWPELSRGDPELRLTIAGKDPTSRLRRMAADLTGVTVTGTVEDMRPFLANSSIYVCPLRDGGGTKLKILDAMAAGLPIVATSLAVEGIAVQEDRHFLRAESPEDFVAGIQRLRKSPALREELAQAGRRLAEEHYSWEAIGKRLEDAYRQVSRNS